MRLHLGADPATMAADAKRQRGDLPVIFTSLTSGEGIREVADWVTAPLAEWRAKAAVCAPAARLPTDRAALAGTLSGADEPAGQPDGVRATARIHATYLGRVATLPQPRGDGPSTSDACALTGTPSRWGSSVR